jgi:hypothetical protein
MTDVADHRTADEKRPRRGNQVKLKECRGCGKPTGQLFWKYCRKCHHDVNPGYWEKEDK